MAQAKGMVQLLSFIYRLDEQESVFKYKFKLECRNYDVSCIQSLLSEQDFSFLHFIYKIFNDFIISNFHLIISAKIIVIGCFFFMCYHKLFNL